MSHARKLRRLLAAGILLAPGLALPLVAGRTASAHATTSTNGTVSYLVHSRTAHPFTRGHQVGRAKNHVQSFSRSWT